MAHLPRFRKRTSDDDDTQCNSATLVFVALSFHHTALFIPTVCSSQPLSPFFFARGPNLVWFSFDRIGSRVLSFPFPFPVPSNFPSVLVQEVQNTRDAC
jgi:hypothetical protein